MKLRTQIFLFLFLFGLVPLLSVVAINVPLIFDRIESLYYKAYLQNLRAEFADLDQHIARRHEMARLLAKMPDPGIASLPDGQLKVTSQATGAYLDWVNRVLIDQLDITDILYLDDSGQVTLNVVRNNTTGLLEESDKPAVLPAERVIALGYELSPGGVLTGPITIDPTVTETAPNRFMQMSLISPVYFPATTAGPDVPFQRVGLVIIFMDVGGLTGAFRGMYWAHHDGRYLGDSGNGSLGSVFMDFPGLEEIFSKGKLGLWEYHNQQVFWVPLFDTESDGPLWVGRSVDPSPINTLRNTIQFTTFIVVIVLLLVVVAVARLIALRAERFGKELTDGIGRVLERDESVSFDWQRPEELHELGSRLNRLAETHRENSNALHEYANELEESNRYKSEFLANVSHELRTPLNSILLLSRMLADNEGQRLSDAEARQASIINEAGSDLKALIDNILDLSRIEARKMTLELAPVVLADLVNDIADLLRPQFNEKGLYLHVDIAPDVPESITTDREKLRQIIVNFLSNAVKFTAQGGATIHLGCQEETGGQLPVRLSVTDTGIGIPANKKEVVFEAFKQADGSTSRHFGGTGLGLTISRELAHLIGGRIQLDSEAGKGAIFTLYLPLESNADQPDRQVYVIDNESQQVPAEPALPEADFSPARVLVVDDDVRNLLALTPLLERWGITVMAAGDGAEALDTLQSEDAFDLVLLDMMMPGMDGYEVIRRLRADAAYRELPVIALTARASKADREQALEAGASHYISKPVNVEELHLLLGQFLCKEQTGVTT